MLFNRPRSLALIVAIIIAMMIIWPLIAGFVTELLWFDQLGYRAILLTSLKTKIFLGAVTGLISFGALLINYRIARRYSPVIQSVRFIKIGDERLPAPNFALAISRFAIPAIALIGLIFVSTGWNAWEKYLLYSHQVPFGVAEPIFNRDISFYIFTLPFLETINGWLIGLIVTALIFALIIYGAGQLNQLSGRQLRFQLDKEQRLHLLILVALFFLAFAGEIYFKIPNLLLSDSGPVIGASYTDLNVRLPIYRLEIVTALILAILAVVSIFRRTYTLLWVGLGLHLIAIVIGVIVPSIVQRLNVTPNELVKETPYIKHNIAATRQAFGLDRIEERELSGAIELTARDIQENRRTINNIRLWDQGPLIDTFKQIQEMRNYYEFKSVDNDRYSINGELQQVMLSPRELGEVPNPNWINERLTFTHGYGLTLGPVDKVTPEGMPQLIIKDIPPTSTIDSLKITRPEIYFGELTNQPVYLRTNSKEFDYPAGDENVFSVYQGEGGIGLGSYWRRLLFATRLGDMKLILSDDLTSESRVLFRRNIRERLETIAPFLSFDSDPYLVVSEGRLFWIIDAYTTSNHYPYSQPLGDGTNYMRNSVKGVIDAYHGHVRLYIADEKDPLIQTLSRIFPGTFKPLGEMSADLRAHLRYPEDIFKVQSAVYTIYHMDDPQIFYNKEDQWSVASVGDSQEGQEGQPIAPYYTIMKIPGEQAEEFILMLPFTPRLKDNLASWMVARSDGTNYGKLAVYRFPKQKLTYGPRQVIARINADPDISRQLSLWDQRGSKVIKGTLMVIPIKESLLYVYPIYLRADNGKIPELRRIIVVSETRIAMEPTLEASINRLFGPTSGVTTESPDQAGTPGTPTPTAPPGSAPNNLAEQAKQHFDRALQAQREGDWARYGEEIKQLGQIIEQMNRPK
jgi:uncharacterized membrane protein (UPF0182 family)